MRARLLLAVLLVVCCAGLRAQGDRHDGNWWNRQTAGFRVFYVMGFIDGMGLGNTFSVPDKVTQAPGSISDSANARRTYKERSEHYFAKVTVGEISDALDTFYRDPRNRFILLPDAFEIVLRSLKGEDVEHLVQARRSSAAGK